MSLLTTSTQKSSGPTVRINCPVCHGVSVPAESYEQIERLELFYVIPLFRMRNTFVKCSACRKQSISKISLDEIARYSTDELSEYLAGHSSLVSKFLPIACVLLFWAPIVGLVLGIAAILTNLRSVGWPRKLSWIGTVLSALVTIGFSIILALD